jgi:hypothetical protein
MLMNIWVRDKSNGIIHQVGTSVHDSLELIGGAVHYYNLQNGDGTGGGYEFVEAPDLDDYVRVTPDELYLNREMVHEELLKMLDTKRDAVNKLLEDEDDE